jgi:hypothetical protein
MTLAARRAAVFLALLAGVSSGANGGTREDVQGALAKLGAPRAAERLAAERWLAAHLAPGDLPSLALAATHADAESLRRLEIALGGDDRHFELAVLLCADSQPLAQRLGEAALARQASRWMGEQGLEPVSDMLVRGALQDRAAPRLRVDPESEPFERLLDRLVRVAGGQLDQRGGSDKVDVVLDPLVVAQVAPARAPGASAKPATGTFVELLGELARTRGLELEGFGLGSGEGGQAWLHLVESSRQGRRRADQLVADWARDLLDPREPRRRAAAARALASCGWSAPLYWLERRWHEGDGAALEGVLLAASRGRVVPSLAAPERVRALLREADLALAEGSESGDGRAELVLHALAALPAQDARGEDLRAPLAQDFKALGLRERFLRAGVLAGMGSAPAEFRAGLRALLADPNASTPPAFEFEFCRTLAATRTSSTAAERSVAARATSLLEFALARDAGAEWIEWLRAARLTPPADWHDPARLPAHWGAWPRALVATAWLGAQADGRAEAADTAAHFAALAALPLGADAARVGALLQQLASGPLRVGLERILLGALGDGRGERLALLAGLLPNERHEAVLAGLLDGGSRDDELVFLGPLAGEAEGAAALRAREVLLALAAPAVSGDEASAVTAAPWAQAFERAWSDLMGAGLDGEAEKLRGELVGLQTAATRADRTQGRRAARLPLWVDLRERRWPALSGSGVVPLLALESPLPKP